MKEMLEMLLAAISVFIFIASMYLALATLS